MKIVHALCTAALLPLLLPAAGTAQEQEAPEYRYVTVTTFKVPIGPERQKVMTYFEKVAAPIAKANPNILSYRIAAHNWGDDARDMMIIAEYASWDAIEADCGKPCQDVWDSIRPEEGSDAQKELQEAFDAWRTHYARHSDQLLTYRVDLSKN